MASDVSKDLIKVSDSDTHSRVELSIITVNWNSKDYLLKEIASIEAETKGIEREILVIDGGSFDGCGEALGETYPHVLFIQSEHNIGFARANNEAFKMSRGRTILFLNPDTEIEGNAIETLYSHLNSSDKIGIAGPKLLNSDSSVEETSIRAFPTLLNQVLESRVLRRLFPKAGLWGMNKLESKVPEEVDAVSGACLMIKRRLFEDVGMFSTDYFMYSEDIDLCLKARQAGFRTHYVPSAIVVHHGGASSSRVVVSTFSAVMMLESRWRFFRKTRSSSYAKAYRVAMFCACSLRISMLLIAWPIGRLLGRGFLSNAVLRKWLARLRWTLGGKNGWKNIEIFAITSIDSGVSDSFGPEFQRIGQRLRVASVTWGALSSRCSSLTSTGHPIAPPWESDLAR